MGARPLATQELSKTHTGLRSLCVQGDLDSWRAMPLAARERALQAEMRTEGNLHPALFPPSDDPSSLLGHYKACTTGFIAAHEMGVR